MKSFFYNHEAMISRGEKIIHFLYISYILSFLDEKLISHTTTSTFLYSSSFIIIFYEKIILWRRVWDKKKKKRKKVYAMLIKKKFFMVVAFCLLTSGSIEIMNGTFSINYFTLRAEISLQLFSSLLLLLNSRRIINK